MDINTLTNKIQQSPSLDFGDIFSKAIELFKKTWLHGFIFTILSMVLIIPAALIIYLPLFGMITYSEFGEYEYGASEFPWVGMIPFFLLFILAMIFLNTIIFAMTAGFFKMTKRLDEGGEVATGDLFMYVKGAYLKKSFVLSLMIIGISLLATLLCYLPLFYVLVPLNFVAAVFAFNPELTPSEIIRTSFRIGNKKWFIAFGLIIVSSILSEIVGLLLCGIGILFTAAFIYLPVYLVYKQVIGFETEENKIEGTVA